MIVKIDWRIPRHARKGIRQAIDLVNRMVWGGTLPRFVDRVDVIYSDGIATDPEIMKGLSGCYRKDQRRAILHIKGLVPQPRYLSQFAWAAAHDLAHAFDVAHGNLRFDRDAVIYMGRRYKMYKQAHYSSTFDNMPTRFRNAKYYDAHQYFEPWETRALFAADAVMAEMRRDDYLSPNLEDNHDSQWHPSKIKEDAQVLGSNPEDDREGSRDRGQGRGGELPEPVRHDRVPEGRASEG